jgi:hypothetical protein
MRFIAATISLVVLTGSAMSQQPYAGLQNRPIKTLSDQQIADLNAGRGMGLALAAELNGYPGPIHAIELAGQLRLSPDQLSKLKSTLISQERELNDGFANHTITPTSLQTATISIGTTQAALRAAHLKYHLSTADILTPEQVARYNELRGYQSDETPAHGQHHQHQ